MREKSLQIGTIVENNTSNVHRERVLIQESRTYAAMVCSNLHRCTEKLTLESDVWLMSHPAAVAGACVTGCVTHPLSSTLQDYKEGSLHSNSLGTVTPYDDHSVDDWYKGAIPIVTWTSYECTEDNS